MQYLKEEIKLRIMEAAVKEFALNGFDKASMKVISHNAGVAIGNIYRYFKNKEELFNEIIEPVHSKITSIVFNKFITTPSNKKTQFDPVDIVNATMEVYSSYSTELMIMLSKSEGTKYKNTKKDLINLVHKRLKLEYITVLDNQKVENTDKFIYVFASVLIDGMLIIFENDEEFEQKKKLVNQLLILYFNRLDERFS